MTTIIKPVILLAVAAAMPMAHAKAMVRNKPKESKVGGKTAVLADAKWQQSTHLGSLEYRDESLAPSALSHDEPLCRLSIRNMLPVQRKLKISAQCERSSKSERDLILGPTSTTTLSIPLAFAYESTFGGRHAIFVGEPNPPASAGGASGFPDPVPLANRTVGYYAHCKSYGSDTRPVLLLSEGITRDSILPSFKNDFDTLELRRKADEWPRDYRAYLPFDAVCLADDVASALPDEARAALRAYELLGGAVLAMQDGARHPTDIESTALVAKERRSGDLSVCSHRWDSVRNSFSDNVAKVPISVGRSLPTGLLAAILALVAVVVMPVTVWYCAKKNRRLLLLAALPGFALAMTVLVALVALAAYGLTPTTRLQAITILDPANRLAVTRGQFAVFSPVQVAAKMSIPADASFRLRGREDVSAVSAVYGATCRLRGDWIKPLAAAFLDFERAERRPERLGVKRGENGAVVIANLLGAPIVDGFVQLDGKRYKVPALEPGEEASVGGRAFDKTSDTFSATPAAGLSEMFFSQSADCGRNWERTLQIVESENTVIPDATYVVRLAGSPFLPSPLAEMEAHETVASVVAGCIAAEGGKEASK